MEMLFNFVEACVWKAD